jgi:hypothetical protein
MVRIYPVNHDDYPARYFYPAAAARQKMALLLMAG